MVIKKLNELSESYKELQGRYKEFTVDYISTKKDTETINKSQEEMKNIISELKNTVEGIKSRLHKAEDLISELEDKVEKNSKSKKRKKRLKTNKEGLRELQDNMKCNNIHVTGIPGGEKEHGIENLFEKEMMENFLNLMREFIQVQEAQRVPIKKNPKRPTPRHATIKMAKFQGKERILKATREK